MTLGEKIRDRQADRDSERISCQFTDFDGFVDDPKGSQR